MGDTIIDDLIKSLNTLILYINKNTKKSELYSVTFNKISLKESEYFEILFTVNENIIKQSEVEHVFDLYFLNNNNVNSEIEMALCKKVIKSRRGEIKCNSIKPNMTEFLITIPTV